MLGYLPQDLIGQISYEYYHPEDIQKMVHLHHDGKCTPFRLIIFGIIHFFFFVFITVHLFSNETTYTHANCSVSISDQEPEMVVVGNEGFFIC